MDQELRGLYNALHPLRPLTALGSPLHSVYPGVCSIPPRTSSPKGRDATRQQLRRKAGAS